MSQKTIANRLKSLMDIEGVEVTENGNTIHVNVNRQHALNFIFKWKTEPGRFIGYFVDDEGNTSQAVIALKSGLDAINFAAAFNLLVQMRARQRT